MTATEGIDGADAGDTLPGQVFSVEDEPMLESLRSSMAIAAAARQPGPVVDVLVHHVQEAFSPDLAVVVSLDDEDEIAIHRLSSAPGAAVPARFDFTWASPMFQVDAGESSAIHPVGDGRVQIGAGMEIGDGRFGCLVVIGSFDDPDVVRRQLIGMLRQAREVLIAVWSAAVDAADEASLRERARLSRELHDSLSQSLWSLSMLSETAQQLIDPDDPAFELVRRISATSVRSQAQMRQLLIDLRSETTNESAVEALERLAERFASSSGVEVSVIAGDVDVPPGVAAVVARVAEEALNNVERHASASSVCVFLDADPELLLIVEDDGVGFDRSASAGHLGVQIMKERAAEIGLSVEVESVTGAGTAVVMARDIDRAVAMVERRTSGKRSSRRPIAWAVAALALLIASAAAVIGSLSQHDQSVAASASLQQAAIMEARIDIGRAIMDEVTADMTVAFGLAEPAEAEAASQARIDTVDGAAATVAELVDAPDPVGTLARQTRELSSDVDLGGVTDMFVGYDVAYGLFETLPLSVDEARPMAPALTLGSLEQVALLGLHEGLIARWASDPDAFPLDPEVAEFFEMAIPALEQTGGYLGADSDQPLRGGLLPTAFAEADDAEGLAELNRIIVSQGLWFDDQWVFEWTADAPPAPSSADDHVRRAFTARDEMRVVVDGRLAQLDAMYTDERDTATFRTRLLAAVAVVSGVGALWCLARLRRSLVSRGRRDAVDRARDPLTGVSNRAALDDQTRRHLQDPALRHHIVVTLDMDRFKAVNDIHGHPFGDRVLAFVGTGLLRLANQFASEAEHRHGVAVRLGGDEFLLSVHAAEAIDRDRIHRFLERLRSAVVSAPDGSLVRTEFSYGLVEAAGSPDLVSLMTSSDLAAYEDKDRQKA